MRPKIVIVTLAMAFGVLTAVALLKGMAQKSGEDSPGQPAGNVVAQNSVPTATNVPSAVTETATTSPAAPSEELRAAIIEKEVDQIYALRNELDGTNNPVIIQALLEKMDDPEAEVRRAALQTLINMNDTNAVPGLQSVADRLPDPHEKVAVLNAIIYLQAPDILDGARPH